MVKRISLIATSPRSTEPGQGTSARAPRQRPLYARGVSEAPPRHAAAEPPTPSPWRRRLLLGAIALVVLVAGGWIGAAFIPRWWSQRIADQVDGSIPAGITLGLVYGFLFTVLPLVVLWWAARRRRSWKVWLAFAALAVLLALPNLFTLGIVVGTGNAAHAGERTLDVEAPGFRGATLAGAILAVLFLAGVKYLLVSRHRARDELDRLRARGDPEPPTGGE